MDGLSLEKSLELLIDEDPHCRELRAAGAASFSLVSKSPPPQQNRRSPSSTPPRPWSQLSQRPDIRRLGLKEEPADYPNAKRPCRRPSSFDKANGSEQPRQSPPLARGRTPPFKSAQALLEHLQACHGAAKSEIQRRDAEVRRRQEDVQSAGKSAAEASEKVRRWKERLLRQQEAVRDVEEGENALRQLGKLPDLTKACSVLRGGALEAMKAAAELSKQAVGHFQQACRQQERRREEVLAEKSQTEGALEEARATREKCQHALLQAEEGLKSEQLALQAAKKQQEVLEDNVKQADELHLLEQKVCDIGQREREALLQRRGAVAQRGDFEEWSEDLRGFFKGRPVRDATRIYKEVKAAMPGMMASVVRAMLDERQAAGAQEGTNDLRDFVMAQVGKIGARLQQEEGSARQSYEELRSKLEEAIGNFRTMRSQLHASLRASDMHGSVPTPEKSVSLNRKLHAWQN
eukprot:TRINITY_DN27809_c0_g2_i1.p1 TRINITY_DN27809_c0_g2~~TRINITY_DN27809_c0_g2_i1.p1  ORF type:complete len:491 (-),score=137.78 TRINITY_DN27809_c0_g2_i1:79-1467(-)